MAIGRTFKEAFQKGIRALEIGRPGWAIGSAGRGRSPRRRHDRDAARRAAAADARARLPDQARARRADMAVDEMHELTRDRSVVPRADARAGARRSSGTRALASVDADDAAPHEAHGLLRPPARDAARTRSEADVRATAMAARRAPRVQDGGHLRRRVSRRRRRTCTRSYDEESEAPRSRAAVGRHPRQRPEPDRAGRRVRLLLRARRAGAARGGLRDDHGQLESRDRLHRLRHLGQAVLRAADARGRARDRRAREAVRRHRAARRPDAAQAHASARGGRRDASSARRRTRSTSPRTGAASRRSRASSASRSRRTGRRRASTRRSRSPSAIGYPVLVRPSYVLGGRAMEIVYDEPSLRDYFERAVRVSEDRPVLIDRFLEDAFEADVDAISRRQARRDRRRSCSTSRMPASTPAIPRACCRRISSARRTSRRCASTPSRSPKALGVVGLINVQYAIKDGVVYVLEVNPRASRTIPFVSKAIGVPLASAAARVMLGETLDARRLHRGDRPAVRLA